MIQRVNRIYINTTSKGLAAVFRFRLWNIDICVYPLFFAILFAAAALGLLCEFLIIVMSAAAHEAAHMATGQLFGVSPVRIWIGPLGLGVELPELELLPLIKKAAVYLSGPAASCVLAVLGHRSGHNLVFMVNAVYCVFNLLPARTLDGGRFIAACLSRFTGFMRGTRVMSFLDSATSAFLIAAGAVVLSVHPLGLGLLCLGKYLRNQGVSDAKTACFRFMRGLVYGGDKYLSGRVFPVKILAIPPDTRVKPLFDRLNYDIYFLFYLNDGTLLSEKGLTELIRDNGMNATINVK